MNNKALTERANKMPLTGFYGYSAGRCREQFQKHGISNGGVRMPCSNETIEILKDCIKHNPDVFKNRLLIIENFTPIKEGQVVITPAGTITNIVFFDSELCSIYFPQTYVMLGIVSRGAAKDPQFANLSKILKEGLCAHEDLIKRVMNSSLDVNVLKSFWYIMSTDKYTNMILPATWKSMQKANNPIAYPDVHYPSPNLLLFLSNKKTSEWRYS